MSSMSVATTQKHVCGMLHVGTTLLALTCSHMQVMIIVITIKSMHYVLAVNKREGRMLKIAAFCVAVLFTSEVSSCPYGSELECIILLYFVVSVIWSFYGPSTINLGAVGSYRCYGNGSYFYWFINGVNSEDISSEELATRGISFDGYYNHYPPYNQSCLLFVYSHLYITGNCLNNNTEIQCMVLGSADPLNNDTRPAQTLTVQGMNFCLYYCLLIIMHIR